MKEMTVQELIGELNRLPEDVKRSAVVKGALKMEEKIFNILMATDVKCHHPEELILILEPQE